MTDKNLDLRVLVTGANGFLGSFVCDQLIKKGFVVHAGVRRSSNLNYIKNLNLTISQLNYTDHSDLIYKLETVNPNFIIHIAGVTNATNKKDFYTINFRYTKNLIDAINASNLTSFKKFVFISSLAAQGSGSSKTMLPFSTECDPKPIGHYGKSKLQAENYIRRYCKFNFVILRPTAIYGPRDPDCINCFKMVNYGIEVHIGLKEAFASFIYVKDLSEIIFLLLINNDVINKIYIVSDNKAYTHKQFFNNIKKALGKKTVKLKVPLFFIKIIASCGTLISKIFNKRILVNQEKYFILRERNWQAIDLNLIKDLGNYKFTSLPEGVSETATWLKKNNI